MSARSRAESLAKSRYRTATDDAYYRARSIARIDPARARRQQGHADADAESQYLRDLRAARRR